MRIFNLYEVEVKIDNPGGEWLKDKQERTEEYIKQYGEDRGGTIGTTTAYLTDDVLFPTDILKKFPGARGERRKPGDMQYDELLAKVKEEGWRQEYPILVMITQRGNPFIVEGNTRVAVAANLGIEYVKTEFKWLNGGEDNTMYTPKRILMLAKT